LLGKRIWAVFLLASFSSVGLKPHHCHLPAVREMLILGNGQVRERITKSHNNKLFQSLRALPLHQNFY
jgi:hypothetical protein